MLKYVGWDTKMTRDPKTGIEVPDVSAIVVPGRPRVSQDTGALYQVHFHTGSNRIDVPEVRHLKAYFRQGLASLVQLVRHRRNEMPRVLLVHLVPTRPQLRDAEFPAARMTFVVVADRRMTIETERDCIVDVGTVRLEMCDLDPDSGKLATQ